MPGRAALWLRLILVPSVLVAIIGVPSAAHAAATCCPPDAQHSNVDMEIINAETGAAVSGAHIRLFRQEDGRTVASLVTDHNGAAWTRLDSGDYRYVVTKPGFQQMHGVMSIETMHDGVQVQVNTVNLLLTPGITPITEDVSLCSDMIDPYQPGTVYVVCNGP